MYQYADVGTDTNIILVHFYLFMTYNSRSPQWTLVYSKSVFLLVIIMYMIHLIHYIFLYYSVLIYKNLRAVFQKQIFIYGAFKRVVNMFLKCFFCKITSYIRYKQMYQLS